ncbi:MAG TPA: bifunctional UDP-sugar hydrolase/5'-nucleotidase [Ktedonobacterales bacterium]
MSMQRLVIFHLNDLHGRVEQLARAATVIERAREDLATPVLFFDAGDSEETSVRLSNLTKGVALHRLLSAAGCDAAAVGNAALPRYGPAVLADEAAVARYPLLLANVVLDDGEAILGTRPAALLPVRDMRLGLIGVTVDDPGIYDGYFGLRSLPLLPTIRELAAQLRQDGAQAIVLLSHLGLPADREAAGELQGVVDLIVGGHTHDLLPEGERVGTVAIAQAGQYGEHLGRIELLWDGAGLHVERMGVLPLGPDIPPAPVVLEAIAAAEADVGAFMDEVIGELAAPLDFAEDRECGVGDLMADVVRERMGAEVGVVVVGQAFTAGLPGGALRRLALWEVCTSPANPALTTLTGEQLLALVRRGLDPDFARERPRILREQPRGLMHLSGAEVRDGRLLVGGEPVDPARRYCVAATDFELERYGGYAPAEWGLEMRLDVPTILREALEPYLALYWPLTVPMGRIQGPLAPDEHAD